MEEIIECIPNFSEARRVAVMDEIEVQLAQIKRVKLVDRHSDFDHNRTVLTLIGEKEPIAEAAFFAAKLAKENIDLDSHTGQHPRIGALDVLPFVPLKTTPMQTCVELAHAVGKRIAAELELPVYFYGEAALQPERKALENVRRGEYEKLKTTISTDPGKFPDEGPRKLGTAGAIAIGARKPLIAFNVFLDTDDVQIARRIARKIRFSSGGFPAVKALGLLVDGKAQVSMNFTDFTVTNLPRVLKTIQEEASKENTRIFHSELVGLLPQQAALQALAHYLNLPDLNQKQLIETHLCSEQDFH